MQALSQLSYRPYANIISPKQSAYYSLEADFYSLRYYNGERKEAAYAI